MNTVSLHISEQVSDDALNDLFRSSWDGHAKRSFRSVLAKSLLYVCAYKCEELVGFVNVASDGGQHAFILDTCVRKKHRCLGIGKSMVCLAIEEASRRNITWIHVDYEPHLSGFYRSCGFQPSHAGVLQVGD